MREDSFIVRVAEMHYKQGLSQQEIAKKLNISRTTVSRTLTQAKNKGIVEIKLNYPRGTDENLEVQLEEKYGLKEVIIAYAHNDTKLDEEMASNAADFLIRMIKNPMTIAMTRGGTMQKMVGALAQHPRIKFLNTDKITVLPTEGSTNIPLHFTQQKRMMYSNFIVEETARILDADSLGFLSPLYVKKATKQALLTEPSITSLIDLLRHADLSMMGIGTLNPDATMIESGYITKEAYQHFEEEGAVGEFMGHIIDINGHIVDQAYEDQLMSLELDDLKQIPIRAGVAYGEEKKEAIRAVLNGHYINVLITDARIARYLLSDKI